MSRNETRTIYSCVLIYAYGPNTTYTENNYLHSHKYKTNRVSQKLTLPFPGNKRMLNPKPKQKSGTKI